MLRERLGAWSLQSEGRRQSLSNSHSQTPLRTGRLLHYFRNIEVSIRFPRSSCRDVVNLSSVEQLHWPLNPTVPAITSSLRPS